MLRAADMISSRLPDRFLRFHSSKCTVAFLSRNVSPMNSARQTCSLSLNSLAGQTLYPIATLGKRVWSNSHSSLVSTGPGISWTGNWFRVAGTSLYKQCGWIKISREVFATRQLFSRAIIRVANRPAFCRIVLHFL